MNPQRGFTLIELIIVITIIGILAGIAVVVVRNQVRKAQETALKKNLFEMRTAIDNFYADKQRFPSSLEELVPNYLRKVPPDPITKQVDWEEVVYQPESVEGFEDMGAEESAEMAGPGVSDVKSKAPGKTLEGTNYTDL